MKRTHILAVALLACTPLFGVQAADKDAGIGGEIRQELAEARKEVRIDLAKAKRELDTENLSLGDGLYFGKEHRDRKELPRAEITPRGDFLIEGKAQAIDAGQRQQLMAYRGQVIGIAKAGIDIGQRSAEAALDAIGNGSWFGLMFGAMTGSLERRVEALVEREVKPGVLSICRQLPAVRNSQQRLAASLPQFRPYATIEANDLANCEGEILNEFASR